MKCKTHRMVVFSLDLPLPNSHIQIWHIDFSLIFQKCTVSTVVMTTEQRSEQLTVRDVPIRLGLLLWISRLGATGFSCRLHTRFRQIQTSPNFCTHHSNACMIPVHGTSSWVCAVCRIHFETNMSDMVVLFTEGEQYQEKVEKRQHISWVELLFNVLINVYYCRQLRDGYSSVEK